MSHVCSTLPVHLVTYVKIKHLNSDNIISVELKYYKCGTKI